MQRIIPKANKVKTTFFKFIGIPDIIIGVIGLMLIALLAFSNISFLKYIFIGLVLLTCITLCIPVGEIKVYMVVKNYMFFFIRRKKLQEAAQMLPFDRIEGDTIYYSKYYAKVIEVLPIQFRLLSESKQDSIINIFSNVLKNISGSSKLQLIKVERELNFDKHIQNFKINKMLIQNSNTLSEQEKRVRIDILQAEIDILENLKQDKVYYPAFYIAFYDSNKDILSENVLESIDELKNTDIQAQILKDEQLVRFVKANLVNRPDESVEVLGTEVSNKIIEIVAPAAERNKGEDDKDNEVPAKKLSPVMEYLSPKVLQLKDDYINIDGQKQIMLSIKDYPLIVGNAWGEELFGIDNTKVVMTIAGIDRDKSIKQLDRSIMEVKEHVEKGGKESTQVQNQTHLETLQELIIGLKNENEVLLNTSIDITYYAQSDNIRTERKNVVKKINNLGFRVNKLLFRQFDGFVSSNLSKAYLLNEYSTGINSTSLAAVFPFTGNRIMEENGVLIGENGYPILIDFFKRSEIHQNSNMFVVGSSGGGKSFFLKVLCCLHAARGNRLFILDPHNEYEKMIINLGGKVIDVSGGKNKINPLQILLSGEGKDFDGHLQALEEVFKLTCEGIDTDSLELLYRLITELYYNFNITAETDISKLKNTDYPIMDDLYSFVEKKLQQEKNEYASKHLYILLNYLFKFTKKGRFGSIWNGHTTLELNENAVAFTFQEMFKNANKTVTKAQMLIITRMVANEVIKNFNNKGEKVLIIIDEAHKFIDRNNHIALTFMRQNAKEIRKYGGSQIVASQSIEDFAADKDMEAESKAIITECQYSSVFKLTAVSADAFTKLYGSISITPQEDCSIRNAGRGRAFFMSGPEERNNIHIVANDKIVEVAGLEVK